MFGPIVPPAGPCPARICIVGEAPGSEESELLQPFVGMSGRELQRMLRTIGVEPASCFRTNVFSRQPPGNNVGEFGTETPLSPEVKELGPLTKNPTRWLHPNNLPELTRLRAEIEDCDPNVVLALGNTACWALLGQLGINVLRGTVHQSGFLRTRPLKVVPTFHPAAILRQWDLRTIAITDMEKAHAESAYPEFRYDNAEIWLAPTIEDLVEFHDRFLANAAEIATDVETKRGQITCLSFAPSPERVIVIPFWQEGEIPHYWETVEAETEAWQVVRKVAESPIPKILQNGLYDRQYFRVHGIDPVNFREDTMLAQHSLFSELRKGLGFLGSIYCNVPNWKTMRTFKREEWLKRDD
jgi:uracil-DNA glycosylase